MWFIRTVLRDHPSASMKSSPFLLFVDQIENECVRYAIYKASGVKATQVCKQFSFEHMNQRSKRVEKALKHAQYIRQAIDKSARTKELAVLCALGIDLAESNCDTSSGESTDEDDNEPPEPCNLSINQTDNRAYQSKLLQHF